MSAKTVFCSAAVMADADGRLTFVVALKRDSGDNVNRLVTVSRKRDLPAKALAAFNVTSGMFYMEYYFKPCEEYVRVDTTDELPDGGKVRLVRAHNDPEMTSLSTAKTEPVIEFIDGQGVSLIPRCISPSSFLK